MIKNKKGWIKIVEAFVAILLIMGTVLIILNQDYFQSKGDSSKIYDLQTSILREIQLDESLREAILTAGAPPIYWSDSAFPSEVRNKTNSRVPSYLTCKAQICEMGDTCNIIDIINTDVYAQSVAISATLEYYNPRQLKIFCWKN